jgi:hypothetical protein
VEDARCGVNFHKSFGGDFDRIDVSSPHGSEWVTIEMRVGYDVERVQLQLRSDMAVRDLERALGDYLDMRNRERLEQLKRDS